MNSSINPGDIVMLIRPRICCGYKYTMGSFYIVKNWSHVDYVLCDFCGHIERNINPKKYVNVGQGVALISRLKKIDIPPNSIEIKSSNSLEII